MIGAAALRDLRIGRKIGLAFAAMLVVSVLAGGFIFWSSNVIGDAVIATERAHDDQARAEDLVTLMRGQASAIRGLLITGDRAYIDELSRERAAFEEVLAQALAAADDAAEAERLDRIDALARRWYDEVATEQVRLMAHTDTVNDARAIEVAGLSERMLDEIAALSEAVVAAEGVQIEREKAALAEALELVRLAAAGAALLSAVFAIGFGLLLVRAIARPVVQMTEVMSELAGGNHAVEIPGAARGDELGAMARAVQVFRENAIERERLAAQEAEAAAAREARARRLEELTDRFDGRVRQALAMLTEAAANLDSTAGTLLATADSSEARATAVAAASEQASGSVQTVAAAAEELAASIDEIGRQMAQTTAATNRAVRSAESTTETVQRLAESARRIGNVITLISEIAEQTNLLALNATIEAARAGEAGKGFAVVASEVKQLASQTAKATEEIGQQIRAIQGDTGGAIDAIAQIRAVVEEVDAIATAIASSITEQRAATDEISRNVQQAAHGSRDVSENIVGVKDGAAQTLEAAGQVRSASGELTQNTEALRSEVERFLADVRAA